MLQEELDEYWKLVETKVKPFSEVEQRKIAYIFCLIVERDLDPVGRKALQLVRELSLGRSYTKRYEVFQNKLQKLIPKGNSFSPISVLIWSLERNGNSYPTWYAAALAGINVCDLGKATLPELTRLIKDYLPND